MLAGGVAPEHPNVQQACAWLASQQQYPVTGLEWRPAELWVVGVAVAVGLVAALIPAWRAYRVDVSRTLAQA